MPAAPPPSPLLCLPLTGAAAAAPPILLLLAGTPAPLFRPLEEDPPLAKALNRSTAL